MMMLRNIKNIALLVLMMVCSAGYAQQFAHTTGNIAGLGNGWVKFSYELDDTLYQDSVTTKNGLFSKKMRVVESVLCTLSNSVNQQIRIFILEPAAIKFNGEVTKFYNLEIDAGKENKLYQQYQKSSGAIIGQKPSPTGDEAMDKKLKTSFSAGLKVLRDSLANDFVKKNPNSVVSAITILNRYVTYPDRNRADILYQSLSPQIKKGEYGRRIKTFIDAQGNTSAGAMAPGFSLADANGKMVSLNDFKGKYVLVDFWASWCGPCRLENPNLIKAYQKFNGKGFTIVGLSMDSSKENWLKAVEQDKLSWVQLNDPKTTNGKVAELYGVKSLPASFLVDPAGKIVAKNLRGNDLEKQLDSIFNK